MLCKQNTLFYSEDITGEHMGLGLAISRVLSQKHGGNGQKRKMPRHKI